LGARHDGSHLGEVVEELTLLPGGVVFLDAST
jgi:hypothetical protein